MTDKENDEFSSAMLMVAAALYVAITAGTVAGLVATQQKSGIAFLEWAKNYGAIIAGVPVMVAVLVAKQQLDANRRQHVATVKRSLRNDLDALSRLERFAEQLIQLDERDLEPLLGQAGFVGLWVSRPDPKELRTWKDFLPSEVTSYADETWLRCGELMDMTRAKDARFDEVKKKLGVTKINAELLLKNAKVHYHHLSEFWS